MFTKHLAMRLFGFESGNSGWNKEAWFKLKLLLSYAYEKVKVNDWDLTKSHIVNF